VIIFGATFGFSGINIKVVCRFGVGTVEFGVAVLLVVDILVFVVVVVVNGGEVFELICYNDRVNEYEVEQ